MSKSVLPQLKHTGSLLIVALVSLALTGCFEIEEKVHFNRDNSGTFSLTIDMSQMKTMMDAMGVDMNQLEGEENPLTSMESQLNGEVEEMNAIAGISNTRSEVDEENIIVSLIFDFRDIDALNAGMNKVFKSGEEKADETFYTKRSNRIIRTAVFNNVNEIKQEMESSGESQGMNPEVMFSDMSYSVTMEFDREIESMSNSDYHLNEEGNSATFTYYFFKPESEDMEVENAVSF